MGRLRMPSSLTLFMFVLVFRMLARGNTTGAVLLCGFYGFLRVVRSIVNSAVAASEGVEAVNALEVVDAD